VDTNLEEETEMTSRYRAAAVVAALTGAAADGGLEQVWVRTHEYSGDKMSGWGGSPDYRESYGGGRKGREGLACANSSTGWRRPWWQREATRAPLARVRGRARPKESGGDARVVWCSRRGYI
jgi:hypothetical protein